MIKFESASKFYGDVAAISQLDLDIQPGELVALIGPSGSGKSTALKMVNRMVELDHGRILFKNQDITRFNLQDLRRRMGYAIQSVGLFPHRTVAHNIATVPRLLGWEADRVRARVTELLNMLSMDRGSLSASALGGAATAGGRRACSGRRSRCAPHGRAFWRA